MGISFPVGVALSTLSYIERMGEGKCLENLQYKICLLYTSDAADE